MVDVSQNFLSYRINTTIMEMEAMVSGPDLFLLLQNFPLMAQLSGAKFMVLQSSD